MSLADLVFIEKGLAADRPAPGSIHGKRRGWWATDTGVLSITDGSSWTNIGPGALPDPSAEPDGEWLMTSSGAAVWTPAAANLVPIADAGSYFTATDVEGALQEIGAAGFGGGGGGGFSTVGYDQRTTNVTVTSTTESSPTTIISCAAHTFDGNPVMLTVYFPVIAPQVFTFLIVQLMESTTEITRIAVFQPDAAADLLWPTSMMVRFTPSAGSHTYTIAGTVGNATGYQIRCGGGSGATNPPAFAWFVSGV